MNWFSNIVPSPIAIWNADSTPIAFHLGGLEVRWYGLLIAIGFILAIIAIICKLKFFYKVPIDPFYYYCLMAIPACIFGAMFWSACIGDRKWSDFFNFKNGGLAIQGGVITNIIIGLIWFQYILKKPKYWVRDLSTENKMQPVLRQVSTWVYADAIIPAVLIGQIIGRWGNYFNQEVYGQIVNNINYQTWLSTHLPFMYVQGEGQYHHPLFLYESVLNIVGLILIFVVLEFIPKVKVGTISFSYVLWYGIVRMCMEPFRMSQYTFTNTYVMDGLWIAISLICLPLNQFNIISLTRQYRCKLFIKNLILTNGLIYHWIKFKLNSAQKKQDQNLINHYQNWMDQNRKQNQNEHCLFIRKSNEFLYYLGR